MFLTIFEIFFKNMFVAAWAGGTPAVCFGAGGFGCGGFGFTDKLKTKQNN